jgi:hypothetical protein
MDYQYKTFILLEFLQQNLDASALPICNVSIDFIWSTCFSWNEPS